MSWTLMMHLQENYNDTDIVGYGLEGKLLSVDKLKKLYDTSIFCQQNQYMTISTFQPYAKRRLKKMVKDILFLHADLDLWHGVGRYGDMPIHHVVDKLYTKIFDKGLLPEPTYIFFTGRGLLLLWRIYGNRNHSKNVSSYSSSAWKRCQSYIYEKLKSYNADRAVVTDYARLFRIIGSINSHTAEMVEAIFADSDLAYNLYDLDKHFKIQDCGSKHTEPKYKNKCSNGIPTDKMINCAEKISVAQNIPLPEGYHNTASVCWNFIHYNQTSVAGTKHSAPATYQTRNAGSFIMCSRIIEKYIDCNPDFSLHENLMWIYRICIYGLTHDHEYAEEKVMELNKKFRHPSTDDFLAQTMSAETHFSRYENAVCSLLCNTLNTDWQKLVELYYENRQYDRQQKAVYNHSYYEKRLQKQGKESCSSKIKERQNKVSALKSEGFSAKEIADKLSMSVRTVQRDLKMIQEQNVTADSSNSDMRLTESKSSKDPKPSEDSLIRLHTLIQAGHNIHIDGAAGTGKTTLINQFIDSLPTEEQKKVLRLAPSGTAASHIPGAMTIHSAFELHADVYGPIDLIQPPKLLKKIKYLIIDEVGMLRFDIFHIIMKCVLQYKNIIVILSGDFGQLSPVLTSTDKLKLQKLWGEIQDTYITHSHFYKQMQFEKMELEINHRLTHYDDLTILMMIRDSNPNVLPILNKRVDGSLRYEENATHLCALKKECNLVNNFIMHSHKEDSVTFSAENPSNLLQSSFDIPFYLSVYMGMPVCTVLNTSKYHKGILGKIIKINKKSVRIQTEDGSVFFIKQETIYSNDKKTSIKQLPLIPAYAITIHRSQGMTIPGMLVIHPPMFEAKMLYTAVSRATNLDNVSFTIPLNKQDL